MIVIFLKMLLHCNGFCKVSRFVNIAAPFKRHIIGKNLERHNIERGHIIGKCGGNADNIIREFLRLSAV